MIRRMQQRRGQKGFTLIELLIVVAIIGVIAAILIPNLLDALQKSKQKRTMGDMRSVGSAMFSWLQDQTQGAAAGAQTTYAFDIPVITRADLLDRLNPDAAVTDVFYIQEVPAFDGWGNQYDFRLDIANLNNRRVMGIWSGGRDGNGATPAASYEMGPFLATDYDQDIVWADGFFVTYPAGAKVVENAGP